MKLLTYGIHHLSSVVGHPQENVDFYAGVLGLRLVKQTLNHDDQEQYHLVFGNHEGEIGTLLTFFPSKDGEKGKSGGGRVARQILAVPLNSFSFWEERLMRFGVPFYYHVRFDEKYLIFYDPHGLVYELVETTLGKPNLHEFNGVTKNVAIKGIYGAFLESCDHESTASLLIDFGYHKLLEDEYYARYQIHNKIGGLLDLQKSNLEKGESGIGTVHHLALIVADDEIEAWRDSLQEKGFFVTKIRDRLYFKSLYFREKGEILIELATTSPGLTVDESLEELGKKLIIPSHYRHAPRGEIMKASFPLFINQINELKVYHYTNHEEYLYYDRHAMVLKRINELAKTAVDRELTADEIAERISLRKEYRQSLRYGLKNMLDNVRIVDNKGEHQKLKK